MKILMIEDQPAFSQMMVHLMEGLDIEVVDTLGAAIERLEAQRYDLLMVDLGLPDSQGIGTIRALRKWKTPKVVISGRFDISEEVAKEPGVIDYVAKTTPLGELSERIMFNVAKVRPRKRFTDNVFHELRACFERDRAWVGELTTA
jgi:DNA-binding response OmpR family regulator